MIQQDILKSKLEQIRIEKYMQQKKEKIGRNVLMNEMSMPVSSKN